YVSLFECMVSFLRQPDLILYLKASPETLMQRIARRGRASESAIGIDYIARLNRAYDEWMQRARHQVDVLEIDTENVPLQGETPAFAQLVLDLKRRFPRQAELRLETDSLPLAARAASAATQRAQRPRSGPSLVTSARYVQQRSHLAYRVFATFTTMPGSASEGSPPRTVAPATSSRPSSSSR